MVFGMHQQTGRAITEKKHLQQSINDILMTPIGSRVMRRNYGSYLFELIDQAANDVGRLRLMAAIADALIRWEPRIKITHVKIDFDLTGRATIQIDALYKGEPAFFDIHPALTP